MGVVMLNGIRLEAPNSWSFHPFEAIILGRPDTQAAVLQISSAFKDRLRPTDGHDRCAAIAREFVGAGEDVFDVVSEGEGDSFVGGFSLRNGDQFTRAWYRCHKGKLIVGICGLSWNKRETPEVLQTLHEVDHMMRSACYEAV